MNKHGGVKKMKKKNLLAGALLSACVLFSSAGFASCALIPDTSSSSTNSQSEQVGQTEIEKIYAEYVVYTEAQGEQPMSYELWLATIKGENGKSAYEIWLANGYNGTQSDFLDWLKGEKGDQGEQGIQGEQGHIS